MFGGLSRLLLLALVVIAVLYAIRQFNKLRQEVRREVPRPRPATQRSSPRQQSQPAVQDLIACRACGAYVAASASGCGQAGCPRPARRNDCQDGYQVSVAVPRSAALMGGG